MVEGDKNKKSKNCCTKTVIVFVILIFLLISAFVIYIIYVNLSPQQESSSKSSTQTKTSSGQTYPKPEPCVPLQNKPDAPKPAVSWSSPGYFPKLSNQYYEIHGWTVSDLQAQMKDCGLPFPYESGGYAVALTTSNYNIDYLLDTRSDGTFGLKNVALGEQVLISAPKWIQLTDAPTETVDWWNKYIAEVMAHENQHKQYTFDIGQEMYDRISAISVSEGQENTITTQVQQIETEEIEKMTSLYRQLDNQ